MTEDWNVVHSPGDLMLRRRAAERLAAVRLPRITMPLTSWFDWDCLRLNVAHSVSPKLLRWT